MAKIVKIVATLAAKSFEVCLADECPAEPDIAHLNRYHRTWTWSLTDNPMTEETMVLEVGFLAAGELAKLSPPSPAATQVSISL